MLNNLTIMGRLTVTPELKALEDGTHYCNFSIATARPKRADKEDKTDFFNCTVWSRLAEIVCEYYAKGDMIILAGTLRTRSYLKDDQKRTATYIRVDEVHFGGMKKQSIVPASNGPTAEELTLEDPIADEPATEAFSDDYPF